MGTIAVLLSPRSRGQQCYVCALVWHRPPSYVR